MLRITNSRLAHGATAALLMLALAGPALAGHDEDDWGDDSSRRGYPVHRHGESCDRDHDYDYDRGQHGRGYGYGGGQRGGYYDDGGRYDERASYGCRPCGRRFDSRERFYRHLSHEHHVSPYWAPRVLVHVGWGWLFRG